MKLVKEYLNEIKRGNAESGLTPLGVGRASLLRQWAEQNFDEFTIKDGVIYPSDPEEYPSPKLVKSGKIPDYVKIIALKPWEMLQIGDVTKSYNSSLDMEYIVTKKVRWNHPKIKDIIDDVDGSTAYVGFYKQYIENKTNLIFAEAFRHDGILQKYLFLYSLEVGVISTYIYNGDKF